MTLEYDRNGVPIYGGEPALWEEYQERVRDLCYGRTGDEQKQACTAVHLRAGPRGLAYEAVRRIPHSDLSPLENGKPTIKGVELLLQTLEPAVAKEKPLRASDLFERIFYAKGAHRKAGEAMQMYVLRRRRELEDLSRITPETQISETFRHTFSFVSRVSPQHRGHR